MVARRDRRRPPGPCGAGGGRRLLSASPARTPEADTKSPAAPPAPTHDRPRRPAFPSPASAVRGYNAVKRSPPQTTSASRAGRHLPERLVIPTHVLTDLKPDECVAVLSRGGEIRFHVHPAAEDPDAIRAFAAREGSEVLATHLRDHAAIRTLVASRERDVGGEG